MFYDERKYFDELASNWDEIRNINEKKIAEMIDMTGISSAQRVFDVGCGTGVLIPFLHNAIGENGYIVALDFSEEMLKRAKAKLKHLANIELIQEDIWSFNPASPFDVITCFNFFPHVFDKAQFIKKMFGMLNTNGCFIIMHDISRKQVNSIHKNTNDIVQNDRLPESSKVITWLLEAGFDVKKCIDNEEMYFIRAVKL